MSSIGSFVFAPSRIALITGLMALCACDPGAFDALEGDAGKENSGGGTDGGGAGSAGMAGTGGSSAGSGAAGGDADASVPMNPPILSNADAGTDAPRSELLTDIFAFAGGDSIGLRWNGGEGATQFNIHRDDVMIGTLNPDIAPKDFPEKYGMAFVDRAIAAGMTYSYRVEALYQTGPASISDPLQVTVPSDNAAKAVVTFDASSAMSLQSWLGQTVVPLVEVWYPKITQRLLQRAPTEAISIVLDPSVESSDVTANSIRINPDYAQQNQGFLGLYIFLTTRLVLEESAAPTWVKTGILYWVLEYMVHERNTGRMPSHGDYYDGSIGDENAIFFEWMEKTYDPTFLVQLTTAYNLFTFETASGGKSTDQLWQEMTGVPLPGPILLTGFTNAALCVESDWPATPGPVVVRQCLGNSSQRWGVVNNTDNTISIVTQRFCLETDGNQNNAKVRTAPCNESAAQKWTKSFDGSLHHVPSGKCLDVPAATTDDGTQLELYECNGMHPQQFGLPY